MKFTEKMKEIITKSLPFLRNLFEEKVIPNAIKKGYDVFDKFADEKIESLAEQVDKYENTLDASKREKYRKGIILGSTMLEAIAEKLETAAFEFRKAVE